MLSNEHGSKRVCEGKKVIVRRDCEEFKQICSIKIYIRLLF